MEPIIDEKFKEICTSIQSEEEDKVNLESFKSLSIKNDIKNQIAINNNNNCKIKNINNNNEKSLSKKSKKKLKNLFLSFLICINDNNNNSLDNDHDETFDEIDNLSTLPPKPKPNTNIISINTDNNKNEISNNNNKNEISNSQIQIPDFKNNNNNNNNNNGSIILKFLTTKSKYHQQQHHGNPQPLVNIIEQMPKVDYLLPPQTMDQKGKKTIVIDLDETLVHSYFKPTVDPDIILPIEMDSGVITFFINKRPFVQELLDFLDGNFEVVVFTASISRYAQKVIDLIDPHKVITSRLFRESCFFHKGNYIKDLSRLGRDLRNTIIVDNSPHAYYLNPENAIPVTSWFCDKSDRQLLDLIPLLEKLMHCNDVRTVLDNKISSKQLHNSSSK